VASGRSERLVKTLTTRAMPVVGGSETLEIRPEADLSMEVVWGVTCRQVFPS
jgi:hypothetical protein